MLQTYCMSRHVGGSCVSSLKRLYEFGPKIDIVNHECNGIGGNGELAPVDAGM